MEPIEYIERQTGKISKEKVYGGYFIKLLYGNSFCYPILSLISRFSFFSRFYGWLQNRYFSKFKIKRFIRKYDIDESEFLEDVNSYRTFNDFFIRKLNPLCRPINMDYETLIVPTDGRYLFYQDLSKIENFIVKGKKFQLKTLLKNDQLAEDYEKGSMMIARLCPTDYHRFHFPSDGVPGESTLINGFWYSVNPFALKTNTNILYENKRFLTIFQSENFGQILYIEVGATNVGSVIQTYTPHQKVNKGEEKGYFSFGASALILIFEQNKVLFDQDLLDATIRGYEIRCLLGQSGGSSTS